MTVANAIHSDRQDGPEPARRPGSGLPVIEVDQLVTHYGQRRILNGVSLTVEEGEVLVIMGGSGS
ncbi:MAG: hypothetical protein KDK91_25105, partial [Gammaproteobacteria bacterium]|nr:hypothetical protein [Gammaproteobacteria bacterium]